MSGDWIDIPALAIKVGAHPQTIKSLVAQRRLPFHRLPGTRFVRFTPEDVAAIEQISKVEPAKPAALTVRARRTRAA